MDANLDFYNKHAHELANNYDSISFESVHAAWKDVIPESGFALDVGAGSGRDARFLVDHGMHVIPQIIHSKERIMDWWKHGCASQPYYTSASNVRYGWILLDSFKG